MKNEFIPYEQALALKELGFDEPCLFAFDNCSTPMRCSDLRTNEQKFYGVNYNNSSYTSQPTYSQAFRWFREKYDYYISVFRTHDGNWGTDLWLLGVHKPKATIFSETYEEAELACLNKLIEIVKQK